MPWRVLLLDAVILGLVGVMVAVVLLVDGGGGSPVVHGGSGAFVLHRASGSQPVAVRSCASHIAGERLHADPRDDLVARPVTFHGLRAASRAAARAPSHAFQSKNGEYRPLKVIADVEANALATVSIAPPDRGRARLVYRLPFPGGRRARGLRLAEGQVAVRFEGCPPSQGRFSSPGSVESRTQFSGGFLFSKPQCLRIDVYDRIGRTRRRYTE